jgi:hypothetical protein
MSAPQTGLSKDDIHRACLRAMVAAGGSSTNSDLYAAVERTMQGNVLPEDGKATVRSYVNRVAVRAGLVMPYDPEQAGWRITPVTRSKFPEGKTGDREQVR